MLYNGVKKLLSGWDEFLSRDVPGWTPWIGVLATILSVAYAEFARRTGMAFPIPFLLLHTSVILAAGIGGLRPGLLSAAIMSAFIIYSVFTSYGPTSLTGGFLRAALGITVVLGVSILLGRIRDRNRELLRELEGRSEQLSNLLEEGLINLTLLRRIVAASTASLEIEEVLDVACRELSDALNIPHVAAVLLSSERTTATIVAERCPPGVPGLKGLVVPLDSDPTVQGLLESKHPFVVEDARSGPHLPFAQEMLRQSETISLLVLPLMAEEAMGAVVLNPHGRRTFTTREIELATSIAAVISQAARDAQLFRKERRRYRIAETLREAASALSSTLDLNEVLEIILQQLQRVIPYDSASVQQLEGKHLRIVACRGFEKPDEVLNLSFPLKPTFPNAHVIETGTPLAIADVARSYPHFQTEAAAYHSGRIRSWLGVPLTAGGQTIGEITLDRAAIQPFTAEEIELATAFANQAAIALQNARLYHELESYSGFLEQAVRERTHELLRTKERVEAILNTIGEAIIVVKPDGRIQQVNPAFEQQTGYTVAEVEGRSHLLLLDETMPREIFERSSAAMRAGEGWRGEMPIRRKDGTIYDAAVTISPPHKPEGGGVAFIGPLRDITQRKELERMKEAFVSNVSHELRTPITSLKLNIKLIHLNPTEQDVYLSRLERDIDRLEELVEDLLRLSRLEQGGVELQLEPVDLNDLVGEIVNERIPVAESHNLTLSQEEQTGLPPAYADRGLLGQVLSILLANALNYTPAGGQVTVSTVSRRDDGERWVGFRVSDTGPGIQAEDLPHLFKRFYRGRAGTQSGAPGTGLGLAIAREIVRRHQGQIEVESEGKPGKGATFTVWVPVAS